MRTALMFIGFLLTVTHVTGQTCYPQKVVNKGDTLLAFTLSQADDLLQIYFDKNQAIEEGKIKDSIIVNNERHIDELDTTISDLNGAIKDSYNLVENYKHLVTKKDIEISLLGEKAKRVKRHNRLKLIGTTIGTTLITILILNLQ